jgi:capsular exopolysaccharide synthesis family protein
MGALGPYGAENGSKEVMGIDQNHGIVPRRNSRDIIDVPLASPSGALQSDAAFTWEQAVRILRKNLQVAAIFALVATGCVALYAFHLKDVYQPTARVEIDSPNSGIATLKEIEHENENGNDNNYLETQAQVLESESLATSVIRILHLDRRPEYVGKKLLAKYTQQPAPTSKREAEPAGENPYLQEQLGLAQRTPLESAALAVFQSQISVNTIRNTRVVEVSCSASEPELAQEITNTLVTEFVNQNYKNRYTTTMQASEWLSGQLEDLRQKVQDSNQAVADYQRRYGFLEANDKDVPLADLMADTNHELAGAQADRIQAEAYVRMIDTGQSDALPQLREDLLYGSLMEKYIDARARLAQIRVTYGDENSNVKKLEDESNELETQVEAERTHVVNRIRTSYSAARSREEMMLNAREKLKAEMGEAGSHMVEYHLLKSEALANAELYNTLRGRLKEAGIYAGLRMSNLRVVDLAPVLQKPTGPHRGLMVAIGAIVSGMFALVFAFVKEGFNNTVRTPDDIRDWTGLPSLAMVPAISANGNGKGRLLGTITLGTVGGSNKSSTPLMVKPNSAEAESILDLRAALILSRPGGPPRVITVGSSSAGEGKTTVSINLAAALSQHGKVCLVDGDLRCPMIANAFGLPAQAGLTQVLACSTSLDNALVSHRQIPNLSLLPSGPLPPFPADLIASEQMRSLMSLLREQFDYVVIDSPAAILFSDARVLSTLADVVVLVSRYGSTTKRAFTRCVQLLDEVRAPVIGVVVNGIDLASPDYQYYNYGFGRRMNGSHSYYSKKQNEPTLPPDDEKKTRSAHA